MRKISLMMSFLAVLCFSITGVALAAFPTKPIKVIVYTKPGGAGDVFTRKFTAIAETLVDAKFVVVNKPGAGGVVAMKHIANGRPDGYQLGFTTRSNIGKIVSTGGSVDINSFSW
ncbi:MAG: tripartite tricarboxylate transporter substrate binding protein, partial [Desulfuromusa sp.]|nr:tripartite tricarboxylate transporter substrate binding protein [Desulfuromusa sp.]